MGPWRSASDGSRTNSPSRNRIRPAGTTPPRFNSPLGSGMRRSPVTSGAAFSGPPEGTGAADAASLTSSAKNPSSLLRRSPVDDGGAATFGCEYTLVVFGELLSSPGAPCALALGSSPSHVACSHNGASNTIHRRPTRGKSIPYLSTQRPPHFRQCARSQIPPPCFSSTGSPPSGIGLGPEASIENFA